MTQTCKQCGAVNGPEANTCCFCDARLSRNNQDAIAVSAGASRTAHARVEGNLATAPNWQAEVSSRMEAYRAKRRRLRGDATQPEFSFEGAALAEAQSRRYRDSIAAALAPPIMPATLPEPAPLPKPAATLRSAMRPLRAKGEDRLEIDVSQPVFDFAAVNRIVVPVSRPATAGRGAADFQVAPLWQRQRAGAWDAALLLFAFGSFWSLFKAMGGHFSISAFSTVVLAVTLSLLYGQYFALFTYFGGSTPGMMLCRLHVVSFDGSEPSSQQMLWRSFGYLISAGTAALGFFWALWDEDHLTWQDRISQTYITAVREEDNDYAMDRHATRE